MGYFKINSNQFKFNILLINCFTFRISRALMLVANDQCTLDLYPTYYGPFGATPDIGGMAQCTPLLVMHVTLALP